MKQLTQAIFDGAPDWVKSAAVDVFGDAWGYDCLSDDLMFDTIHGIWDAVSLNDACIFLGEDYDATECQNSAIDREVLK